MSRRGLSRLSLEIAAAILFQAAAAACAFAASSNIPASRLNSAELQAIAGIVHREIEAGRIPGAVIEIGQDDRVVYDTAFGYRESGPRRLAMTPNTIFDLASLTKPVATTTAIMQLCEDGKIDLEAPAARYWPDFGRNGKNHITVRELLTHYSGLPADLDLSRKWRGYGNALRMIEAQTLRYPPGAHYQYSDINFEVLGEIVRRVSSLRLDIYCRQRIFAPLGMRHTGFRPPLEWREYIAPTLDVRGEPRVGLVHDPTAERMEGIAGHAGLFSNAGDLAIFARMLLNRGHSGRLSILSARSIAEMTAPQSPEGAMHPRGLGWDLGAPIASNRGRLLPVGSFGHTGFTGTLLWVDPVARTYVIILTNRTYPNGTGDAGPLRKKILALVGDRIGPIAQAQVVAHEPELATFCRLASDRGAKTQTGVATGLDVLVADGFTELQGARVGLITNHTGVTRAGMRNVDLLAHISGGPELVEILTPEHGFDANAEGGVSSGMEPGTELPLYSLYGSATRPSDEMLDGVDALVFDVQDVGARFYTYLTTMAYAMEAAAHRGIDFYILDRPDPISASVVQGPVMDTDLKSFTGYFPLPTRYGMTIGELATMFNSENHIGARLHVIRMAGYRRPEWYDQTGLSWIPPSPNLRTSDEAALYPGVAMVEGANVSVGRGTGTPFELLGAPWIEASPLAAYLEKRAVAGVRFEPVEFTPTTDTYAGQRCRGVRIKLVDRDALASPDLGLELISALHRLYPEKLRIDATLAMLGSHEALRQIKAGVDLKTIASRWQPALAEFKSQREKYLLY